MAERHGQAAWERTTGITVCHATHAQVAPSHHARRCFHGDARTPSMKTGSSMNAIARCLLATLPCVGLAAAEATDEVSIDHWGNALLVTAPDNHQDTVVTRKLQAEVTLNLVDASI